mgnify:CR=1 FL=1
MSTAGTGYMYTTRRLRVMERLSMMKYDPIGTSRPRSRSQATRPVQGDTGVQVML